MKTRFKFALSGALVAFAAIAIPTQAAYAADKPVIAGIVFQQDIYMKTVLAGMRAAAKAGNATLLEANSDNKIEKEAQIIDTFIARGVNAIVLTALHSSNSVGALERARAKGITVVTVGTGIEKQGVSQAFVKSSDKDIGLSTGDAANKFIKEKLDGKAKVAIVAFKALVPSQSGDRTGGFLENVNKNGVQIQIVAEQDAWLPEKAVAVAGDILTAHPEVNVIYAANEGGTVGAMQAVKNAGKEGKVFVFGTDGSEQLGRGLLASDNVLQATTAQQPFVVGEKGVKAALDLIKGKPVKQEDQVPVKLLSRNDKTGVEKFIKEMKALN